MRLVNIQYVKEGSILARPVLSSSGTVLLREGVHLTASYIERLKTLGYDVLFIQDSRLEDVQIHVAITAHTREVAYKSIELISGFIERNPKNSLPLESIRITIQRMIEDLLSSTDILGNLTEIQVYDDYTFHHSINTSIISLILGIGARYSERKLIELGMGVLMHDIGKIMVPEQILNKKNSLTQVEFEEIKKHTTYGFEILRKCNDLSLLSAHVTLQHHEKWDGTGYPRRLKGKSIHEYGRLAAIADVYEALTSKRVYRNALEPNEAYEYIISQRGTHFDPQILDIFKKNIAVYPSGSGVLLSNGQRGNVIKQNPAFPNRPFVRVFYENERALSSPIDYNLAEYPSIMIIAVDNR